MESSLRVAPIQYRYDVPHSPPGSSPDSSHAEQSQSASFLVIEGLSNSSSIIDACAKAVLQSIQSRDDINVELSMIMSLS